ncbi:hypothetical protein B0H67DRAFT_498359 [Lasiosphaeris hirsuta]|uniref:Chorismate synthase protein n=1 Tax=Lasiosphaeris hirsuta TaxID=260670 RepID=A0AA40DKU0_9PEZI|nr:hypothetical protein B0H67DRAFT_498359 [Lasiosphaeris hirsuta]
MAIPWGTIKSLLLFFGPMLVPKAISYYRAAKNAPGAHGLKPQPIPPAVARALLLLFAVAVSFLLRTLPMLSPENVFAVTQSRLQIPADVLFTRLAALRPDGALSATDMALRARFVNLESRLLYLQFGPSALAECPFCSSDDANSYMWYALPDLVAPHLLNLAVIAIVTSRLVTGRDGAAWRTVATIAGVVLTVADVYLVSTYNYQLNSRALRLGDIDFFYWTARIWRAVALAALDGVLGWLLFLSSTNRAFGSAPTPAERVESAVRVLSGIKGKLNAVGVVKNTAIRDDELRARGNMYWGHEVMLMREVMEERDVIEGVNDAVQNRIDLQTITRDAEAYAEAVLKPGQQPS